MSADWLPTVAALSGSPLLPALGGSSTMGTDMSAAFILDKGPLPTRCAPLTTRPRNLQSCGGWRRWWRAVAGGGSVGCGGGFSFENPT